MDWSQLLALAPLLARPNNPHSAAMLRGYLASQERIRQQGIQQQQLNRQDAYQQAQLSNMQADNRRADEQMQMSREGQALQRLTAYRHENDSLAQDLNTAPEQVLGPDTTPLQAQNNLTVSRLGAQQEYGIPAGTPQGPLPNMTQAVSNRDKRLAQQVLDRVTKNPMYAGYQGSPELEEMTVQFKGGQLKKIRELRQIAQESTLMSDGQPLPPKAKDPEAATGGSFDAQFADVLASEEEKAGRPLTRTEKANLRLKTKDAYEKAGQRPPAGDEPLSPDDVEGAAQSILAHRMAPSQLSLVGGMGNRGVKFKQAVVARVNALDPSYNWQAAEGGFQYGKNSGTQTTVRYLDNVAKTIPMLRAANSAFKRSGVRFINDVLKSGKSQFGDVTVADFDFKNTLLADEIAKVLQGGGTGNGTSDAKLRQAQELLSGNLTTDQYDTVLNAADEMLKIRRQTLTDGTFLSRPDGESSSPAQPPGAYGTAAQKLRDR